jgi:hypothetical protein
MDEMLGADPGNVCQNDALAGKQDVKFQEKFVAYLAEAYSDQELDSILAFYKSPGGKAMVEKSPALMTDERSQGAGRALAAWCSAASPS